MLMAVAAPWLLAYNRDPSPTVLNQLLALAGWGSVLLVSRGQWRAAAWRPAAGLWLVLGVLACASGMSWGAGLPTSLWMCWLACLGALAAVLWASQAATEQSADHALNALFNAVLMAGVASALIAVVQVFLPLATDNLLVARSPLPGRAVGNLRQPNHLSDLLSWSLVAWVVVRERTGEPAMRPVVAWGTVALLLLGLVLTGSRSAVLSLLLLALWGAVDRRLQGAQRRALWLFPVVFALLWLLVMFWAHSTHHVFGGQARLGEADLSASRSAIWRNVFSLLMQHPWTGVGLGRFNLAWSLSSFPNRPLALFDHTHNLPLQWAVELGLPLAGVMLMACGLTLWRAQRGVWRYPGPGGGLRRAAMVMVWLMVIFSLIEYPLWYAYFSLPFIWLLGVALRSPGNAQLPAPGRGALQVGGALMLSLALWAALDYGRVLNIYRFQTGVPVEQRIDEGLKSRWFSHWAAYARVTMHWTKGAPDRPPVADELFAATAHSLVDPRLLKSWSQFLEERGDTDRARYLAQRLREFRRPEDERFFAVCQSSVVNDGGLPYQCQRPASAVAWQDFRH